MHAEPLSSFTARHGKAIDVPALARLIHDCIEINYRQNESPAVVDYYRHYHALDEVKRRILEAETFVLESRGKLLATATLEGSYINAAMVRPTYQHMGFGKTIMDVCIKRARAKQLDMLFLDAVPGTIEFYKGLGFQGFKEHWMFVPGGERLFYVPMKKLL